MKKLMVFALATLCSVSMSAQDMKYCIVGHIDFLNGRYFAKFELLVRR